MTILTKENRESEKKKRGSEKGEAALAKMTVGYHHERLQQLTGRRLIGDYRPEGNVRHRSHTLVWRNKVSGIKSN